LYTVVIFLRKLYPKCRKLQITVCCDFTFFFSLQRINHRYRKIEKGLPPSFCVDCQRPQLPAGLREGGSKLLCLFRPLQVSFAAPGDTKNRTGSTPFKGRLVFFLYLWGIDKKRKQSAFNVQNF
jgi:hypothetical protein